MITIPILTIHDNLVPNKRQNELIRKAKSFGFPSLIHNFIEISNWMNGEQIY